MTVKEVRGKVIEGWFFYAHHPHLLLARTSRIPRKQWLCTVLAADKPCLAKAEFVARYDGDGEVGGGLCAVHAALGHLPTGHEPR